MDTRGNKLTPGLTDSLVTLLSQPLVAVVLGLALGIGLLLISRVSFRGITAEDPMRGLVIASAAMIGRLFASVAILYLYSRFFQDGFIPFALSFATGFLALYMVELVRFAGLHRFTRPVAGSRDGR